MKIFTLQYSALILGFILNISSVVSGQDIRDIIPPIKIHADAVDTVMIGDLFYASRYDVQCIENSSLSAVFDQKKNVLIFKVKEKDFGAALLDLSVNGKKYSLIVLDKTGSSSQVVHTFIYSPESNVKTVAVEGSFNNWNKTKHQLTFIPGRSRFELPLSLEPGDYVYKFVVDGVEIVDPLNPEKSPTGFDNFNSVLRIADTLNTKIFLHTAKYERNDRGTKVKFYYENNLLLRPLSKKDILALLDNKTIETNNISIDGKLIQIQLSDKELSGEKVLRLLVTVDGKNSNLQKVLFNDGIPAGRKAGFERWDDALIYSIMIDRFNNGDTTIDSPVVHDSIFYQANYQGGDLKGIIQKLDDGYFDSLGINTFWISPVYDNPAIAYREYPAPHRWYSGYHGYWPVSDTIVEEKFGSMDGLKNLIKKAHDHKIKVLLDFIAHHVHIENPLYAKHPEWFGTLDLPDGRKNLRLWDEYRLSTWFEPYMPSYDFQKSAAAIEHVSDNAIWWLKTTGADGFRHDAVKHVPNEFWRALTKKIKEQIEIPLGTKVYQIGETFGDYDLVGSYVNNGQLSAQFNFDLSYFAIPVFTEKGKSFSTIDFHMKKSFFSFGEFHLMGNIMDSHDKVRFMAYADGAVKQQGVDTREMAWKNPPIVHNASSYKKAELFLAFMFTIPGLPVIYYGSEFGMTGADDPDNRRMMRFGDSLSINEKQMLKEVKKITALRKDHPALRYGDFLSLQADTTVYVYVRSDMNERLIVILNKSESEQMIDIRLPEFYGTKKLIDCKSGEQIAYKSSKTKISVPAISWRIFSIH